MRAKQLFIAATFACASFISQAQEPVVVVTDTVAAAPIEVVDSIVPATPPIAVSDSLAAVMDSLGFTPVTEPLPATLFLPVIYTGYDSNVYTYAGQFLLQTDNALPEWLESKLRSRILANSISQNLAIKHLELVPYNIATMPEPPKKYIAIADPKSTAIVFKEVIPEKVVAEKPTNIAAGEIKKKHWINKLGVNLQFSQAFVSPNWYQGGNNALSLLSDFTYDNKLNTTFHPDLMFENFVQWKTVLTSTPDNPYRPYSLSENRFQYNSKFGYKAIKNWYYSINAMLKTPIFNGYNNTNERTASFLSPGEVNVGLGMTFNTKTKNEKFSLGLTVAPLSYNLKTVIDPKVNEMAHGLAEGHKTLHSFGSNLELKWDWTICKNISWVSRIYAFTNYNYIQSDWQNTFNFNINRFFSACLSVDMRFDNSIKNPTTSWKLFQLREMFSLGFTYTLSH